MPQDSTVVSVNERTLRIAQLRCRLNDGVEHGLNFETANG